MNKRFLTLLLCLVVAGCVFLTGCNNSNTGSTTEDSTPSGEITTDDTTGVIGTDISGTWETGGGGSDLTYYLTFSNGEVSYTSYSPQSSSQDIATGSYTIADSGEIVVSLSDTGQDSENTYVVAIDGDTLTLSSMASESGIAIAGTYTKSKLPGEQSLTPQETSSSNDIDASDDGMESTPLDSAGGNGNDVALFLASVDTFTASTDTYLGKAYEDSVIGYFSLDNPDGNEGTFTVYVEDAPTGSLTFSIEGETIHFSNSDMGTHGSYSLEVTDTYFRIEQTVSDAEGEDLLNTIVGTWYASND